MKSHAEGHFNEVNLDSDGKSVLLQWDKETRVVDPRLISMKEIFGTATRPH